MRGNQFGKMFSITTFGESHGPAMGVVIDGMPSKINVNRKLLQDFVNQRRPGRLEVSTDRDEADRIEILSGVFDNQTLGTPICVVIKNTNQKSEDYANLKDQYRPGHADQTTLDKYHIRDYRGGGRASGRETVSRVIGGYFASLIIPHVEISTQITKLAHFSMDPDSACDSLLGLADKNKDDQVRAFLLECKRNGESCGGEIFCRIKNTPKGLGEPVFDKLKADLSKAVVSIGSCMGIHFGLGDEFITTPGKVVSQKKSNFSGIEGGISNGDDIHFRCIFKAPSTVGEKAKQGRHDPCILPRVLPVVKSMVAITIADHYLRQQAY